MNSSFIDCLFFYRLKSYDDRPGFFEADDISSPRHLRDQLRQDLMRYEEELTEGIADVLHKGASAGLFNGQEEERLIASFYVCVDGMLVENQLYEEELFEKRKQMTWKSLWQLWTMTARED